MARRYGFNIFSQWIYRHKKNGISRDYFENLGFEEFGDKRIICVNTNEGAKIF